MSAATAVIDSQMKEADIVSYFMGAVKIFKGTLVSVRADGYLYPSRSGTAGDVFAGVAGGTVDNSAGAAGATRILVWKRGTFVFTKATAVQTDVGVPFYASDDNTLTATTTNNQKVGVGVELIDSSHVRIRIDTAAS